MTTVDELRSALLEQHFLLRERVLGSLGSAG